MNREDCIKAVDDLLNEYDAYYIMNKYDEENNTHKKQFEMLIKLFENDSKSLRAIQWIHNCYDCYYKNQFENDDESPFAYLKGSIDRKFGVNND